MQYIEIKFTLEPYSDENAEILIAMVEELGFDSYDYQKPCLLAYIQESIFDTSAFEDLVSSLEGFSFNFKWEVNKVEQENWNAQWESSFEPVIIDGLCTIKASYHENLEETPYTICINPEMSFGTGHHDTTYLIAESLLLDYPKNEIGGKRILDMGCGTAILAILAAKIKIESGAVNDLGSIVAIDIDPTATDSASNNTVLNEVEQYINVKCGDAELLKDYLDYPFDIILANINRNILLSDMEKYYAVLKMGGEIYFSGFYSEDAVLLENKAKELGLSLEYFKSQNDWTVLKFAKK